MGAQTRLLGLETCFCYPSLQGMYALWPLKLSWDTGTSKKADSQWNLSKGLLSDSPKEGVDELHSLRGVQTRSGYQPRQQRGHSHHRLGIYP